MISHRASEVHILYKCLRSTSLYEPAHDPEYLKYVRSCVCVACGNPATEPHHVFGSVHGLKSSDYDTLPLCREHHNMAHADHAVNVELLQDLFNFHRKYIQETR